MARRQEMFFQLDRDLLGETGADESIGHDEVSIVDQAHGLFRRDMLAAFKI